MAYKVESPTKKSGSLKRSSQASGGYSSALAGFSTSLDSIRKTLLNDQLNQIDYQIEVGAASTEDKMALYEGYLGNLEPNTAEYYRVSLKIATLQDQLSNDDFNTAKLMYADNQLSSEEYYRILKERVAEQNISAKELKQRQLELHSFEKKATQTATDKTLREATMLEDQGLITAADRLNLLTSAYNSETDPDRKLSLKYQIVAQRDKVNTENVASRELLVRKGIQEGTATKQDLLAIYAEKLQTAKNPNDALQAEINLQGLIKDIETDIAANVNKNSNTIKKETNTALGTIDRKIAEAERTGDITGLNLLYQTKAGMIEDYMNSGSVTLEDKAASSKMTNWLRDTWGVDYDPETGSTIKVTPTATNNVLTIQDALMNPDSSLLVKTTAADGTVTTKLVRGEKVNVAMPDGTTKTVYDFGKNVAITRLNSGATVPVTNPLTGEVMKDAQGNTIMAPSLPTGREIKTLPTGYAEALKAGNVKPLAATDFKGEYVDLYTDAAGNTVRAYKVYGDKYKNTLGAAPVEGETGAYLLTTKNNEIPSQKYIKENHLFDITNPMDVLSSIGQNITAPIKSLFNMNPLGALNQSTELQQSMGGQVNPVGINTGIDFSNLNMPDLKIPKIDIPEFTLPDFSKLFNQATSGVGSQLLSSLNRNSVQLNTSNSTYGSVVNKVVDNLIKTSPAMAGLNFGVNIAKSAGNFLSNSFNAVSKWLGGK